MSESVLVWFDNDFRLHDNPALIKAIQTKIPLIPIYIHCPEELKPWPHGEASLAWLEKSLEDLQNKFKEKNIKLVLRKTKDSKKELISLIKETKAVAVYWNKRVEPSLFERDQKIVKTLCEQGIDIKQCLGRTLFSLENIKNKQDNPYKVFTPFSKFCFEKMKVECPLEAPSKIRGPKKYPASLRLKELKLAPTPRWDKKFWALWKPGESGALERLKKFKIDVARYSKDRDFPSLQGTSQLSAHLHFGEISPRQLWHVYKNHAPYLRQILWREFAIYSLYHAPDMPTEEVHSKFKKFSWKKSPSKLKKWTQGRTGYPIVDAGMRELWQTGWMHNRVRMIVGSFLVKDLMINWRAGQKWFWETLLDADLANNAFGWQWIAGCGLDAAPYFRIFNPITQSEKFDPSGRYIKKFVPELKNLDKKYIHTPWLAPPLLLQAANITLGKTYPLPIVDHSKMRNKALEAFKAL